MDDFVAEVTRILTESGAIYRFGDSVVMEAVVAEQRRLLTLATALKAEPNAAHWLSNLLVAGIATDDSTQIAVLPGSLTGAVLASPDLWDALSYIRYYAVRPTFNEDFHLCDPGWNPASGVLYHGPTIRPSLSLPPIDSAGSAASRLPPRTGELLGEFPWQHDADLVNTVAGLVTGLIVNHVIDQPHPLWIFNGNQRGVGKTLLAQTIGRVLDGVEPPRIPLVGGEEELSKRLGAELLDGRSSMFLFDNAKQRIDSVVLEQNALAPELRFRHLGRSSTISRRNAYLWIVTANQAAATEDLVSRSVFVSLRYEGDPGTRSFARDPLEYAAEHRLEILGELVAMVQRWVDVGRPLGAHRHRCSRWAALVGGILTANGLALQRS
jgi:hypothetical protein